MCKPLPVHLLTFHHDQIAHHTHKAGHLTGQLAHPPTLAFYWEGYVVVRKDTLCFLVNSLPPLKPPGSLDIRERTIRHWTLSGKLKATKHGTQFSIAVTGIEAFADTRPPDVKELLTRLQALEDLEEVQTSQASRLTDLERQVFLLQAKRISELQARLADLERRRRKRKPSTAENSTSGPSPEYLLCTDDQYLRESEEACIAIIVVLFA